MLYQSINVLKYTSYSASSHPQNEIYLFLITTYKPGLFINNPG